MSHDALRRYPVTRWLADGRLVLYSVHKQLQRFQEEIIHISSITGMQCKLRLIIDIHCRVLYCIGQFYGLLIPKSNNLSLPSNVSR